LKSFFSHHFFLYHSLQINYILQSINPSINQSLNHSINHHINLISSINQSHHHSPSSSPLAQEVKRRVNALGHEEVLPLAQCEKLWGDVSQIVPTAYGKNDAVV
jgi:hypothetical protein